MSVKFNVVERGNPAKPGDPKKFYPSIVSSGRVTLRALAQEISKSSTVSTADTMAVLEALLTTIPDELAKGNIVEMGDFGNFWLRNSSEGVEKVEDARASQISAVQPRFNPGQEFQKVLDGIKFEKA